MQKRKINNRKTAILVGVFYIIGTVAGIFSAIATGPSMTETNILAAIAANPNRWTIGTLLILLMGFPLAMIPALTYPIFKKHNEVLAMGTIIFRGVLEAMAYVAYALSMLMLFSLSQDYGSIAAADAPGLMHTGRLLVNMGDWINVLLAIIFSIGAMMFNYLLIQTRLVPRWLSGWGFIGAILYFAAPLVSMLEVHHYAVSLDSILGFLLGPLAIQEMVFAVWVIVKGFNLPPAANELLTDLPA